MAEYNFGGVTESELRDRVDGNVVSGVPPMGQGQCLLRAAVSYKSNVRNVRVQNRCQTSIHVRLRHANKDKTVTTFPLVDLKLSGVDRYLGMLAHRNIVPGTISITNANGAVATIVDDEEGILVDTGTTTARGTINYTTGAIDFTYGATPTLPVRITYHHTDGTDFQTANQTTASAALGGGAGTAGAAHALQTTYGRVVPGSVSIADTTGTPLTFVDDGRGNIIQFQTTSSVAVVGTINYATGAIVISDASAALSGTVTVTYKFNPFAGVIVPGGAAKLLDLIGGGSIPELSSTPWGAGMVGESYIELWGETTSASAGGHLSSDWAHFGEDPFRVEAPYSGVPVGGVLNN